MGVGSWFEMQSRLELERANWLSHLILLQKHKRLSPMLRTAPKELAFS